jgi:hypothetical protein
MGVPALQEAGTEGRPTAPSPLARRNCGDRARLRVKPYPRPFSAVLRGVPAGRGEERRQCKKFYLTKQIFVDFFLLRG